MKFPQGNKSKSQIQGNKKKQSTGQASGNGKIKNMRNKIQQQRANSLQTKKVKQSQKREQVEDEYQANTAYNDEDEVGGMDAYNVVAKGKSDKGRKDEYDELMQKSGAGFKRQKNLYFLENAKYQGRKQSQDEENVQEEQQNNSQDNDQQQPQAIDQQHQQNYAQPQYPHPSNQQPQQQQQSNSQQNQIHQALSLLKSKRQSTSKLIHEQLQQINLQDKSHLEQVKKSKLKSTKQEMEESLHLRKQLEIYDRLVELRYGQQKEFQDIKQYPKMDEEGERVKYPPVSHELFEASRELESQVIANLGKLFGVFKKLAAKSGLGKTAEDDQETAIDLEAMIQADNHYSTAEEDTLSPGRLNVDKIYNFITESISQQNAQVQKQLIKWSQKTSFLSNTSPTHLNSLLMQTPVGQAKKVMSNWQRIAHKCQQKRGKELFRILFQAEDNIHELSDPQIYDDYDFFIELEKYYLEKLDGENEDGEFLQSATLKYLKNRQANQLQHEKKQKDVDRKASKNRKIRYNVHAKLLNFMPSCPQNVIQTRDEIVRNIFNCNAAVNEDAMQGNVSKYRSAQPHQQTEYIDIQ